MKYLLLTTFIVLSLSSCLEDNCTSTQTFVQIEPVYVPEDGIRPDIKVTQARELEDPGNIYYYKDYLLVNERRAGIHIIDNSNPESPENIGFIEIAGNLDMAVKNDVLYADLYLDLIAIDITNPMEASIIGRTDGVFSSYYPLVEEAGYIVEYVPTTKTIKIDCDDSRWGSQSFLVDNIFFANADALSSKSGSGSAAEIIGVGGSMARFTLAKDYLYALDDFRIRVFDINSDMPSLENTVDVEWGIETLFPYGDYLFIGANAGMYIMDNSNPTSPTMLSQFVHAQGCDPVFVSEDVAYVTLRGGNFCNSFSNQLDVINVSDMTDPYLIRSYQMDNPHGLSVVDETLFLCEGEFGLKVYSVEDKANVTSRILDHVTNLHSYDVIALDGGKHLIVVGQDGIYQFDSSDEEDLKEVSRIAVNRKR